MVVPLDLVRAKPFGLGLGLGFGLGLRFGLASFRVTLSRRSARSRFLKSARALMGYG